MRKKLASMAWLPDLLALLGALAYFVRSGTFIQSLTSVLDEGLYLYKGYLFTSGRYFPFQDFGPWTNHMPLSFLIPGWVQLAFGPGIRTGRYFALFLGLLMLLGLWIAARRLGGRWWAVGAVWILVINGAWIKWYSQAISQSLTAAMLSWVLVFTLGKDRSSWQLLAGSLLAGILLMTRVNMLPLLPILIVYLSWEHGLRTGVMAAAVGLLVVAVGHALFWPGIIKLWANLLPAAFTPFLSAWRESSGGIPAWNPQIGLRPRLLSLQGASTVHMLPLIGALFAWLSWPSRSMSARKADIFRIGGFLSALFAALFLMHAWASLAQNYCVFCLEGYLAFFSQLGILLLVLAAKHWIGDLSQSRQRLAVLVFLGVALATRITDYDWRASTLLSSHAPRIAAGRVLPGTVELWVLIEGKLGIPQSVSMEVLEAALRLWTVLILSLVAVLAGWILLRRGVRVYSASIQAFFWIVVGAHLVGSTLVLDSSPGIYDCGGDVISSYEAVGRYLSDRIPPDSLVYWDGGLSPVPLLSLPTAGIFPPQLNDGYSRRLGGDAQELLRFGYWNDDLAQRWLQRADYVLVEEQAYNGWITEALNPHFFDEIERSPPAVPCRQSSAILIFRRMK